MKKALVVLLAMVFAIGVSVTAQAAFIVNCKTNSEAIQKVGCEKAGSVSFTFDAGSVLTVGDWWYADLPVGVTLCSPINYEIVDGAPTTPFGTQNAGADGASLLKGTVVVIKDLGGNAAADGITAGVAGVWFRVTGNVGSQRVLITVMGAAADTLSVDTNVEFTIKILDEQLNNTFMFEDTGNGAGALPPDGIYGNDLPADNLEAIDNTFCINATQLAGNLVNVSYDSRSDFLTFTGDNEVAHVVAANPISLQACKGDTTWPVDLSTTQTTVCTFDYETGTGRYCPGFGGNDMIVKATNALDEANYRVRLTITSPAAGVYWGAAVPTLLEAYTPAQNACPGGTGTAIAPGWNLFKADGITVATVDPGDCSIAAADMGTVMESIPFPITLANNYNAIRVDMANLVFDSSVAQAGQIVTIKIELIKEPCGVIFTGSRDIATFVLGCAAAVVPLPIVAPYFPPILDASWWGGAAVCNTGSDAVDVTATFYEKDGDVATWEATIPGHGLVNNNWAPILSQLVPSAGNTGTIGDSPYFIIFVPSANTVKVFFMMGDGYQSMGQGIGPTCP